jgi:hypothetical protein
MGTPRRHLSVGGSIALVLAVIGLASAPADALSCAPHPDASPQAIASGTDQLATGGHFFDRWDRAVLATVVAIDTRESEPRYAFTTITLDVHAVLGSPDAPSTMELSAPDPGWMSGPMLELGSTYLVSVMTVGPDGDRNWTHACDPLTVVADPADLVDELVPLARVSGIALSTPEGVLVGEIHAEEDVMGAPTTWHVVLGTMLIALAGVGVPLVARRTSW